MTLDNDSLTRLAQLETGARFPSGIGQITRGECGIGAASPFACTFCLYGHLLECHYPRTCDEAQCGHYQEEEEQAEVRR